MPKEIANKTKEETYYKCTHCWPAIALAKESRDEIFWNTHKKLTYCIVREFLLMVARIMSGLVATKETIR